MKTCICAIIKDEQDYIEEWLDYHLGLGFNHIYLYEDYYSTSHKDIVDRYDNVSLSNLKDFGIAYTNSAKKQRFLYEKFAKEHKEANDYDWVLFTDIDEYLVFDEGYDTEKLLKEYEEYPGILLSWKCYNASGHIHKAPKGVSHFEYYTQVNDAHLVDNYTPVNIKSFVNLHKYKKILTVHIVEGGVYTDGGTKVNRKELPYAKAWINHYFCRSFEDYVFRLYKRGNQHNNYRTFDNWFRCNPEFADREYEMIKPFRYKRLVSTCIISKKYHLIAGGNEGTIKRMKEKMKKV